MIPRESSVSDKRRRIARLGPELERCLSAYAGAAAAAGVSLLALTNAAQAKIVYTPANTRIPYDGGPVPLDLNHDGIADFFLSFAGRSGDHGGTNLLQAGAEGPSNQVWGRGAISWSLRAGPLKPLHSGAFAYALRAGFTVGPNKSYFQKGEGMMAEVRWDSANGTRTAGQWGCAQPRYLGLKFMIGGQVHYGWARERSDPKNGPTLTGYAYETVANKPIVTGKTKGSDVITPEDASLGCLAKGASGISAWRTNPQPAAAH